MAKADQLWKQLNKEDPKQQIDQIINVKQALEAIKKASSKPTVVEKVRFAGQVIMYGAKQTRKGGYH